MLLLNISKLIEEDFFHNCIATLKRIKKPRFVDQCILNIVCENKVKFLDAKWNVENHLHVWRKDLINELPNDIYQEYENNLQQAKFLHYTGSEKPWQNPASFNADLWWKYAQKTPFYEEIIYKNAKKYIEKRKSIIPMKYTNLLQRIFSIKNDKSRPDKVYKVVTILGLKLKLKKRV